MFKPSVIAIDYETALTDGTPSVEYYRPDFRVVSCSFSWFDDEGNPKHLYRAGEYNIWKVLKKIQDDNIPVVVHNFQFEYGVTLYRFTDIQLNWYADTMRLAQVGDNGGRKAQKDYEQQQLRDLIGEEDEDEKTSYTTGLGLQAAVSRFLPPEYHNHKEPYYRYLREQHGVKARSEGKNLHLLPPDMLEAYNTADTLVTLLLYHTLTAQFAEVKYDWQLDHTLYMSSARKIAESKGRGISVNREALEANLRALDAEIGEIWESFRKRFRIEISALEQENLERYVNSRTSERGQAAAWLRAVENPEVYQFNLNSGKQKARLFVDLLGIEPRYRTEKGAPAFGKAFLAQWGEGGAILAERGSKLILRNQMTKLLELSSYDGRWHIDLRAAGTTTGRFAGSGGLNVQGLARREQALMGCLVADPGYVFVSCDLSAGEPTVTTHYSQDHYYNAATFGMVGKAPYYDDNGVLMIDDIYLMGMSVSPMGKARMREVFEMTFEGGLTFAEQWLKDKEYIQKKVLKKERAFHKILILGLGYAMGPKHMTEAAFKAAYELSLTNAKAFFKNYWKLYGGVKRLSDALEAMFERDGFLVNDFGYRLLPYPSYKALNYFIQSSVSGIMHVLCAKFFATAPYTKFVTVIHDEVLFQVPEHMLTEAREAMRVAEDSLNQDLGWSVNIRVGWAEGRTLMEAK